MFKILRKIIRALRDYSREACRSMKLSTKGSILWIILLQSRKFALGEVKVLCEFTIIHKDLRAKWALIYHSEILLELINNTKKKEAPKASTATTPEVVDVELEKIPKKPHVSNPRNWTKKLKVALKGPMKETEKYSFTKIMQFCNKDVYSIITKGSPICAPNAFLVCASMATNAQNSTICCPMHRYNQPWTY